MIREKPDSLAPSYREKPAILAPSNRQDSSRGTAMSTRDESPLTGKARVETLALLARSWFRRGAAASAVELLLSAENCRGQPPLEMRDLERILANADHQEHAEDVRRAVIGRDEEPGDDREPHPVVDDTQTGRKGDASQAPEPAAGQTRRPAERIRARITAAQSVGETITGSNSDRRPAEVALCETCHGAFQRRRWWAKFCSTKCRMIRHGRIRVPEGAE